MIRALIKKLNKWFRLSFTDSSVEESFQRHYFASHKKQNAIVAKVTLLIYATYAPLTYLIIHDEWFLLISVSIFAMSGAWGLLYCLPKKCFNTQYETVYYMAGLIVGLGPIAYYLLTQHDHAMFQVDVLLPVIGLFTMLAIGFSLALITVVSILLVFLLATLFFSMSPMDVFSVVYVFISGGLVVGLASYFMEQSNRRLFLAKHESDEFRYIIDHSRDDIGIISLDEWRFLFVNKRVKERHAKQGIDIIGKRVSEIYPQFSKQIMEGILSILEEQHFFSGVFEFRSVEDKSAYYAHIKVQYGFFHAKKVLIAFASDVTTEKAQELELRTMAVHDPLTGLFNRYKFDAFVSEQMELYKRYKTPVSMVICDIDFFKQVNDSYGHVVGDEVLVKISQQLKEATRENDIVSRWGGEEFAILLPHTDISQAMNVAEKIRKKVRAYHFGLEEPLTISCGISELKEHDTKIDWFKRVDEALYQAKKEGRNQVCKR